MAGYGVNINKLLRDYLRSDEWRSRVHDAAAAADAADHSLLSRHVDTGVLEANTRVTTHEFSAGYGARITSIWRSFFVANKRGRTRNRRGSSNSALYRAGRGIVRDFRHAEHPSVFGEAEKVFDRSPVWGDR